LLQRRKNKFSEDCQFMEGCGIRVRCFRRKKIKMMGKSAFADIGFS
jgi:hypothetical protein